MQGLIVLNPKRRFFLKISGICGLLSPMVVFSCILLAVAYASDFSWMNSALSDLGIMPDPTRILFNSGLIVGGILAVVFAARLFSFFKGKSAGQAGAFLFLLDCLALIAIGIFPESVTPMHIYASVAFFMLFPLSMFLMTAYFVLASRGRMAAFTFLISVFAAVVWILEFWVPYAPGVAIPETLSGIAASIWVVVNGYTMLNAGYRSVQ
jgi:hypothetical membrane protein